MGMLEVSIPLKILPSSHSSATWCIMVKVSMWCLPTTGGVLHITIVMIRKVTHFNGKITLIYNMMYTQILHKHIKFFNKLTNSFVVRINF